MLAGSDQRPGVGDDPRRPVGFRRVGGAGCLVLPPLYFFPVLKVQVLGVVSGLPASSFALGATVAV